MHGNDVKRLSTGRFLFWPNRDILLLRVDFLCSPPRRHRGGFFVGSFELFVKLWLDIVKLYVYS